MVGGSFTWWFLICIVGYEFGGGGSYRILVANWALHIPRRCQLAAGGLNSASRPQTFIIGKHARVGRDTVTINKRIVPVITA
jgi:hypothetical protein